MSFSTAMSASETMSCAPLLMIDNSFTEAKYCRARSPASMIRFLAKSKRSGSFTGGPPRVPVSPAGVVRVLQKCAKALIGSMSKTHNPFWTTGNPFTISAAASSESASRNSTTPG